MFHNLEPQNPDNNVGGGLFRYTASAAHGARGPANHEPPADHERLLPIANVGRIMKQILPPKAKISKAAKETMQECVSEFIGFVTGEASDKCRKEKRKTVNGDDVCWALGSLGFDDYAEVMKRYLSKCREGDGDDQKGGDRDESGPSDGKGDREATVKVSADDCSTRAPSNFYV